MSVIVEKAPTFYGFVTYDGNSREYLFKTYYSELVPGDLVITKTKRGLVIGEFTKYGEENPIATAWIIGVVDRMALEMSRDG